MKLRLVFIGEAAEAAGRALEEVEVPGSEARLSEVLEKLRERLPGLRRAEARLYLLWYLVNGVHAGPSSVVRDGDEITVMPPLNEGG